jgi:hypothetical protein
MLMGPHHAASDLAAVDGIRIIEKRSRTFAVMGRPLTQWATATAFDRADRLRAALGWPTLKQMANPGFWTEMIDRIESALPAPPVSQEDAGDLSGLIDWRATPGGPATSPAERCRLYLERVPDAISGQGGHNATLRAAAECYRFGLSESDAWAVLQWFNGAKCQPAWNERDLRHKLREGKKVVDREGSFGKWIANDRPTAVALPNAAQPTPAATISAVASLLSRLPPTAADLAERYTEMRPPIIHGLLRQGETMNVIAPPKAGKSWLVADLSIAIASGRRWLETFDVERGRVLIIDNELHGETIAKRLPMVGDARKIPWADYSDRLHVETLRDAGAACPLFDLAPYFARFDAGQFRMIVLDAFYRFLPPGESENDNALQTQLYNFIDQQAARLQCCFVVIHHTSKGTQAGKAITDIGAGGGAWPRAADTHLVLRLGEYGGGDACVMEAATRSWQAPKPLPMRREFPIWTPDTFDPAELVSSRRKEKPSKPPIPELSPEAFADRYLSATPQTQDQIVAAALQGEPAMSQRKAKALLALVCGNGLAVRFSGPRVTDKATYRLAASPSVN